MQEDKLKLIFDKQANLQDKLYGLDNLINLKQQQIDLAEQWKKGLMQGMFV